MTTDTIHGDPRDAGRGKGRARPPGGLRVPAHRYTRTKHLLEEFFTAFNQADRVIIMDIYAAGEQPIPGVSGKAVYEGIRKYGHKDVAYLGGRDEIVKHLCETLREGDLLLTLGRVMSGSWEKRCWRG